MNPKKRLAGRFLPSRVYARWKWTVRTGLSALPLLLFVTGSVVFYLTPSRYESTAVFEYLGKRTLQEAAALLKSHNVISRAITNLELTKRMEMDSESLSRVISKCSRTTVDPATGMIKLRVELVEKDIARDLAAEIPQALDAYERSLAAVEIGVRLEAALDAVARGEDEASAKRQDLARMISVRGDQAADPVSQLDLDAARGEWERANRRVLDHRERADDARRELSALGRTVVIHSQPSISENPTGRNSGETMLEIIARSLGIGLAYALAVPYLLELAFPGRRRSAPVKGAWSESAEGSGFEAVRANG